MKTKGLNDLWVKFFKMTQITLAHSGNVAKIHKIKTHKSKRLNGATTNELTRQNCQQIK